MNGRSQDKLGPERNTLGRNAEHPALLNIDVLVVYIITFNKFF
jgi:hypothetical protein